MIAMITHLLFVGKGDIDGLGGVVRLAGVQHELIQLQPSLGVQLRL